MFLADDHKFELMWATVSCVAIRCVRRAVYAAHRFAVGAQTIPVCGRKGPFWYPCTLARSNLAMPLATVGGVILELITIPDNISIHPRVSTKRPLGVC